MKRSFIILFALLTIQLYSQSPHRLKLLIEYDFPRRLQVGVKLLSSKMFSFNIKGGYQLPSLSWGSYSGSGSNISKIWSLLGPVIGAGSELNFKKPYHKISLDVEYGSLVGSSSDPNYLFKGGRDYEVTYSDITAQSYTGLLGYYYHFPHAVNLSSFIKAGVVYRSSKEHVYYEGSRSYTINFLKKPFDTYRYETEFTVRIGLQYCFGYSKLTDKITANDFSEIRSYIHQTDSVIKQLFDNYQYSYTGVDEYKDITNKLLHWMKHYKYTSDTTSIDRQLSIYKELMDRELKNRAMKAGTYKLMKKSDGGPLEIKRIRVDYYNLRHLKKYAALYAKYKLH